MMRQISTEGRDDIKKWEAYRDAAYNDQGPNATSGTWTCGWGHIVGVKKGDTCDVATAEKWLSEDLAPCEKAVDENVLVVINDNQFAALVSFAFNVGVGPFLSSTLLRELNKGNYTAVPIELAKWNKQHVNGQLVVSDGLTNRRAVEAALWVRGAFVASQYVDVSPPPLPPSQPFSVATAGAIVGVIGTGAAALTPFAPVMQELVQGAPRIMASICAGAAAVGCGFIIRAHLARKAVDTKPA